MLLDHALFGQDGHVRTAACTKVEWQMINVRVLFFQAMLAGDEQSGIDMNVNYGWTTQLFHYTVVHQLV